MSKIKVSEATGTVLDWLVATCEGVRTVIRQAKRPGKRVFLYSHSLHTIPLQYSSTWSQAGPILEREGIQLNYMRFDRPAYWTAHIDDKNGRFGAWHATPLIAAMRCYVTSKLGEEVEVPDELVGVS